MRYVIELKNPKDTMYFECNQKMAAGSYIIVAIDRINGKIYLELADEADFVIKNKEIKE